MKTDIHRSPAFWAVLFILSCFYAWHVVNDSHCAEFQDRNKELEAKLTTAQGNMRVQKDHYENELQGIRNVLKTLKTEMVSPAPAGK